MDRCGKASEKCLLPIISHLLPQKSDLVTKVVMWCKIVFAASNLEFQQCKSVSSRAEHSLHVNCSIGCCDMLSML